MIKDKDSSENKGFAFVTYNTEELATKAAEDLNNREFMVIHWLPLCLIPSSHTYISEFLMKAVKFFFPPFFFSFFR